MPLNNIEQEVIARFRKEYREAYKGILSEDVLKEGNKWFEDYLLSALSKAYEEGKRESVEIYNHCLKGLRVSDPFGYGNQKFECTDVVERIKETGIEILKNKEI